MSAKWGRFVLCFSSRFAYSEAAKVWPIYRRRIVPSNGRLMWQRYLLIIEMNRLVKRAFDVAGRESSSRCGDSSGDENIL